MKKALKAIVAFALYRLGGARLLFLLHRIVKGRPVVTAVTYHRVVDAKQTAHFYTDYDRGLDVGVFRVQVDVLRKYFDCVDVEEFVAILTGKKKPARNTMLVTFDDADSEFMGYAYPVLSANHVRATVMVPTRLVESEQQLWHVRVSNLVMSATDEHWEVLRSRSNEWPPTVATEITTRGLGSESQRRATCTAINRALDKVGHAEVEAMIEAWEALIGPQRHLGVHCMTWQELGFLAEHEIGIESHTASHHKLTQLHPKMLLNELTESKATIERQIGKPVLAVAYPQGYFDENIGKAAREAGYAAGFTTVKKPCRYPVNGSNMFEIPRMDVVGDTPQEVTLHLAKICLRSLRQT